MSMMSDGSYNSCALASWKYGEYDTCTRTSTNVLGNIAIQGPIVRTLNRSNIKSAPCIFLHAAPSLVSRKYGIRLFLRPGFTTFDLAPQNT